MRTSVKVSMPSRGSRSSRRASSLNARCNCWATRRLRGKDLVDMRKTREKPADQSSVPLICVLPNWRLERSRDFDARVALDLIARADVVVIAHRDTALGTSTHFIDVIFEATQRFQLTLEDHYVIT